MDRGRRGDNLQLLRAVPPAVHLDQEHAANEKLWALKFPDLCPPTLVAADNTLINAFVERHEQCVIKPVDGHAGRGVLPLNVDDSNRASIIELLTCHGRQAAVVQEWIAAVRELTVAGDRTTIMTTVT